MGMRTALYIPTPHPNPLPVEGRGRKTGASLLWLCAGIFLLLAALPVFASDKLIGSRPPEWQVTNWLNSSALKLEGLRGRVVLVRWWTAPDCPYCRATAPALNEFYEAYHAKGLEVIGFYHHKSEEPLTADLVKKYAAKFGFKFPVAIDTDWKTLHRWWLDGDKRDFTSVSFLIDKQGVIRHIHPGGEYVKGDKDYAAMKVTIEKLLEEK
jgi:peroxiredoxin